MTVLFNIEPLSTILECRGQFFYPVAEKQSALSKVAVSADVYGIPDGILSTSREWIHVIEVRRMPIVFSFLCDRRHCT
jgi:hypothetical protein